jgi:hypothetical protein
MGGRRARTAWLVAATVLLAVGAFVDDANAQTSNFAMACTYRGGQASFVVSGDYVKGEAAISRADGTLAKAFVTFEFNTSSPKLAVLLKGKGRLGEGRDLYIIDTGLGTFTHVNEIYADGPDKDPSMVVQVGTCTAAAPR